MFRLRSLAPSGQHTIYDDSVYVQLQTSLSSREGKEGSNVTRITDIRAGRCVISLFSSTIDSITFPLSLFILVIFKGEKERVPPKGKSCLRPVCSAHTQGINPGAGTETGGLNPLSKAQTHTQIRVRERASSHHRVKIKNLLPEGRCENELEKS